MYAGAISSTAEQSQLKALPIALIGLACHEYPCHRYKNVEACIKHHDNEALIETYGPEQQINTRMRYMRRFNRVGRAKHIILCIFFSSVKVVLQRRNAVSEGPEYCDSTLAMALEPNVFSREW
eukprot:CCRYP_015437-RA/>CCRYP_015437-RA protein AED:0.36 eAED:0.56 QI:208/0/0/1/0/0/2/0/122